ncbi:MAG: ABC transporter ATP-binding protein [Deltaproteobacteria bacterium]|nr:ABC transporter ATP-binding protein [Deltaproteobacteria bacterium]
MSLDIIKFNVIYRDGDHSIQALEDVSLEIKAGQCVALVGESGSGKTTLGKACLGLLPANADHKGEVLLDGEEIDFSDEVALNRLRWKRLSMVFQDGAASLNPVHRIIDQVAEPLIQHEGLSRDKARDKATRFLEEIGLSKEFHNRYPHQLSGGQVQRGLLAMAMILDPAVIILDEPTSALDALTKGFVAEVIREAKGRGKALLLITHDLEFAMHNAEIMAVLYLGQIMETLPADEMLSHPLHPYTMALGRSYPAMETARDLGGIRGDAFYRIIHQHGHGDAAQYRHAHIQVPKLSHSGVHAPPTGCLFHDRCTQAIESCTEGVVALEKVEDHTVRCLRRGIVTMLELKGVTKRYGKTAALNPLDLNVRSGELLAIVGETGSGKTTLAMIAAGVIKPNQGRRMFYGHDMDAWMKKDHKSLAKKVGVIYQNPAESISHRFSVYEAVAEPLTIHGEKKDHAEKKELVKSILADVHLSTDDAFLRRYPHELNMGALQRVCLARALVLSPLMLIADEPTSSLDPSVQAKVLKLLLDLQIERGLTMLFVSHDIGLARKISDRMGVMLAGQLVEIGPSSLVITKPLHPYTKLLIESARGNWEDASEGGSTRQIKIGCPFRFRCPRQQEICAREAPSLRLLSNRHVACHFPYT